MLEKARLPYWLTASYAVVLVAGSITDIYTHSDRQVINERLFYPHRNDIPPLIGEHIGNFCITVLLYLGAVYIARLFQSLREAPETERSKFLILTIAFIGVLNLGAEGKSFIGIAPIAEAVMDLTGATIALISAVVAGEYIDEVIKNYLE